MTKTKIEWADRVWNPVTGCTKVSEGCRNCYAERIAKRFWKDRKFSDVVCHGDRLDQPIRWKKPSRIFVNSMSDLFHPDVPDPFIASVFGYMHHSKKHTFIVLTKRPERMFKFLSTFNERIGFNAYPREYPHVWLGVSVENQQTADERIPLLLKTPAAKRIVSFEPALGPVDFVHICNNDEFVQFDVLGKHRWDYDADGYGCAAPMPNGIDWVIMGGESGPGARPMHPDWARSVRDQCQAAGVPFFFKQFGEWADKDQLNNYISPIKKQKYKFIENTYLWHVGKKNAGHLLDGKEYLQFPDGKK